MGDELAHWLGYGALAAGLGATLELILTTVAVPLAVSDWGGLALFWLGCEAHLAPIGIATGLAVGWLGSHVKSRPVLETLPLFLAVVAGAVITLGIRLLRDYILARDLQFPREVANIESAIGFGMVIAVFLIFHFLSVRLRERVHIGPVATRRIFGVAAACGGVAFFIASYIPLASLHLLRSALAAGIIGMVCLTVAVGMLVPPPEKRLGVFLGALALLPWALVPLRGASACHATYLRYAHAPVSGGLAALFREAADLDGDGSSPRYLGGYDCSERDTARGPGVREIPGDGIDQDCSGGDAPPALPVTSVDPGLPSECSAPDNLSVILITIDAMRADMLRPDLTPHLFELSRHSLAFSRAYAPSTMTNVSMAAVFSGRPYSDLVENAAQVPSRFLSIPSIVAQLRQAGVETVAFNRLALDPSLASGFSEVNPVPIDVRHEFDSRPLDSAAQSQAALKWIERGESRRFVWVHYADGHAPYRVPSILDDGIVGYPAAFRYIDQQIGILLGELSSRNLLGRYAIAVTADHGEELGQRLQEGHGTNLFEESVKVPLLLWIPGCAPRVEERPVSLTKLMPSLARILGLRSAATGLWSPDAGLPVVVEEGASVSYTFKRAVVLGNWKMIVDERSGGRVLFDLANDSRETENIYPGDPELASRLERAYQRWIDAPGHR